MTAEKMIQGLMDGTVCEKELTKYDWRQISGHPGLSEEFIRTYADRVDWWGVSIRQKLSEDFIREYADRLDWQKVPMYQKLSEDFIREHADRLNWVWVSVCQKLSEDFIREHADRVDWKVISTCQKLSENFIRQHADRVSWQDISKYQILSETFIEEFEDQVDWKFISAHQYLSDAFIRKHKDQLYMHLVRDSWAYKTSEELEQAVRDTGLYECHEDYFIAYKGIRSDRYSCDNFQYRYLPGGTYETFADYSDRENSFGFFVWTQEKAEKDCEELVIPCRVYYRDVARVVYDGGKIRCRKITVLA